METPEQPLWRRAIRFALGETVSQRCVQLALLLPAAAWLRLRNKNAPWEGLLGKHISIGKPLTFDEHLKVQLWQAADICCATLFLLVLLSPWWMRWAWRKSDAPAPPKRVPTTRRALLWLCAGLAFALAVRLPLFHRPILRDEQDTVRRNILGYVIAGEGPVEEPVVLDWETTVWEDAQANNPFLFSILARVSLRTWQAVTGAEPWRVNLSVLRLWALVPGVLSLAALWRALRYMGHPRAAWYALFVGAIHPLHMDYSTQARGYGLVMLFVALALDAAWRAMEEGRWRHWIALAASFLGMLYANPASAYFVASLGGAVGLCLAWRAFVSQRAKPCVAIAGAILGGAAWFATATGKWGLWLFWTGFAVAWLKGHLWAGCLVAMLGLALACYVGWLAYCSKDTAERCSFARLGICGAAAFLIFVPLVWPALPQAAGYLKEKMQGSIGGVWPISAWSRYASGVMMPDAEVGQEWLNFAVEDGEEAIRRSAKAYMAQHYLPEEPWLFCVVFLLFPALMFAGALRFFRQHSAAWPVLAGGIGAPLVGYAMHHWLLYTFIYYWYLIYAMPVVVVLMALGIEVVSDVLNKRWRTAWSAWLPAVAVAAVLFFVNRGGPGRMGWFPDPVPRTEQFDRGRFLWTTYPDGKTVREPDPAGK
jgi:hypothetical protein